MEQASRGLLAIAGLSGLLASSRQNFTISFGTAFVD